MAPVRAAESQPPLNVTERHIGMAVTSPNPSRATFARVTVDEVTFTLTGFQTVKREGIEVSGRGVFTVNADMKVGSVQETITVRGETPVVDTHSVRRQTTISGETLTAIPTARSYGALLALIPGVTGGPTGDVQVTPGLMLFSGAGGRGGLHRRSPRHG